MPSVKINGATYDCITEMMPAGNIIPGVYYAVAPYGHCPRVGPEENNWEPVDFPNVSGQWTKDRGFRRRGIQIQLVIIGTSKTDTEGRYLAVQGNISQRARYSIQFPGGNTFQGCKLVTGQAEIISEDAFHGGFVVVVMSCLFVQLSKTNG